MGLGGQECPVFDPFRPPRSAQSPYSSRLGGVQRFSFWGRRWRIVQIPTRVGTLKGVGWGRESHGRDGELGRRLVRGRRGGSVFRPLPTPGEGVDPSIQAIGAGSKILFFGGEDRGSCSLADRWLPGGPAGVANLVADDEFYVASDDPDA